MSASLGPHQKASCNRWQLAQQPQGVKVQRAAGNRGKLSPRWAAYITPLLLRIQDHGVCMGGGEIVNYNKEMEFSGNNKAAAHRHSKWL